jgi:alkylated DNA repair dioxygenase AlkB
MARQGQLFLGDLPGIPELPEGFRYHEDFVDAAEEAALLEQIAGVEFSNFEMHGVIAKRRVAFFGASYDREHRENQDERNKRDDDGERRVLPMPEFLLPLRERIATWVGVRAEAFAMALINEYQAGAPIGWHRDAPQYDIIAGLSLVSPCRMKFRPYVSPSKQTRLAAAGGGQTARKTTHELSLSPRSIYLIAGPARQAFEHSIPAVATLRYSITFRTLRDSRAERAMG